jgi:hypothetical protein
MSTYCAKNDIPPRGGSQDARERYDGVQDIDITRWRSGRINGALMHRSASTRRRSEDVSWLLPRPGMRRFFDLQAAVKAA